MAIGDSPCYDKSVYQRDKGLTTWERWCSLPNWPLALLASWGVHMGNRLVIPGKGGDGKPYQTWLTRLIQLNPHPPESTNQPT